MTTVLVIVATTVIVVAVLSQGSPSQDSAPAPSVSASVRLPPGARPLPGDTAAGARSFGVTKLVSEHSATITKSQALRRYDRIPGAASRTGARRRVLVALVEASFIDGGKLGHGTFWIISVWFHPPDIGVSPQRQWCVDHGLVNADSGRAAAHIYRCLPLGKRPSPVLPYGADNVPHDTSENADSAA
jgi:hypothetical protein